MMVLHGLLLPDLSGQSGNPIVFYLVFVILPMQLPTGIHPATF